VNDTELADKLVEDGIGCKRINVKVDLYSVNKWPGTITPHNFVRDWRVAGACMEKCAAINIDTIGNPWWVAAYVLKKDKDGNQLPEKWFRAQGKNLPRAICLAYVEAMSDK